MLRAGYMFPPEGQAELVQALSCGDWTQKHWFCRFFPQLHQTSLFRATYLGGTDAPSHTTLHGQAE